MVTQRNPTIAETREKVNMLLRYVWEALPGTDRVRRLAKVTRERIAELPETERPPLLRILNTSIPAIPRNTQYRGVGNRIEEIEDMRVNLSNSTSDLEFITQLLELRKLVRNANNAITTQSNRNNLVRALGDYGHVLVNANNDPLYSTSNYNMSGDLNPDFLFVTNSNNNSNNNNNYERGLIPRRLFNNSNNNNNHNYASWANMQAREIMDKKSKNFASGTKWGVKANKNNAKEWYNSTTGQLKNVSANNVYANNIGGDVFKPGQLKNLYFDANAKGSAARKLYTRDAMVKAGGLNPYTKQPIKPRKLTTNIMNAIMESMKRRGVNSTREAKKILGKNATANAIKKKAMELYMNN